MLVLPVAFALLLAPQSTYKEAMEIRLQNIDVVVTDAAGVPVNGLRPDDFEVLEDGARMPISNFVAFEGDVIARTSSIVSPPPPRTVVFFIDAMNLEGNTVANLQSSFGKLLETMRDGDSAAIVRADGADVALTMLHDRASIEAELTAALKPGASRVGLASEYASFRRELTGVAGLDDAMQVARRHAAKARERVVQRIGTLRAIITAIAPLPGRKAVVAVTQSLAAQPGRDFFELFDHNFNSIGRVVECQPLDRTCGRKKRRDAGAMMRAREVDYADLRPAIAELSRIASSKSVSLYVIRPAADISLTEVSAQLTDKPSNLAGGLAFIRDAIQNTNEAADPMADITGGRHFHPGDDLDGAMQGIARDLSSYYSLAYHANSEVDAVHRLEVRVRNRPELAVRARTEVERRSTERDLTDRVVASLMQREAPNDLHIGVQMVPVAGVKKNETAVEIRIPLASMTFEKKGGVYRARYNAHYAISGNDADFVSGVDLDGTIDVPAAEWPAARAKHWTHVVTFPRLQQGYRVAVGVMDVANERSGIATTSLGAEEGRW